MMIDNKELAKYIYKRMTDGKSMDGKVPTITELTFWIQQFKTRKCDGHSEWSDRDNRNIWVSDYEED